MRILPGLVILLFLQACKHPLAIEGEGDIVDLNGGTFGCTLEQFQSGHTACTDNNVTSEYDVNYQAIPRPGWKFVGWEGDCGHQSKPPYCRFEAGSSSVDYWDSNFADIEIPALTAVFEPVDTRPLKVVSACPSVADTEPTPTNSRIKLKFKEAPSKNLAASSVAELTCDRVLVGGRSRWNGRTFSFRPETALPEGATCNFRISANAGDGSEVIDHQQNITVGDGPEFNPTFKAPINPNPDNDRVSLGSILVEGKTVVLLSGYNHDKIVRISRNGGKSFDEVREFTTSVAGSVQWSDAKIQNGELYYAWTVLPSNHSRELIYTSSENGLTTFRAPALISDPYDAFSSTHPSLGVTNESEVFLAWGEECAYGVSDCFDVDWASIHIISIDGLTGKLTSYDELSRGGSYYPELVAAEGEILIAWMDQIYPNPAWPIQSDNTVRIFNYSQGMNELAQFSFSSYHHPAQFNSFLNSGPTGYHLSWNQSPYQHAKNHYAVTLDQEYAITGEQIPLQIDTEEARNNLITDPVSNGKGVVAWIEYVALDGIDVDDYLLWVHDMNSGIIQSYQLDDITSHVRGDDVKDGPVRLQLHGENQIHMAWIREDLTGLNEWLEENPGLPPSIYPGKSLQYTRGTLGVPCANL